jgi:hypothetical protein
MRVAEKTERSVTIEMTPEDLYNLSKLMRLCIQLGQNIQLEIHPEYFRLASELEAMNLEQ